MNNLLKSIYFKLISPKKVAQILGVEFGENPKFRTKKFGSEPYLIKVGDNFETSSNVSFVTHDGSVGVLRNLYPNLKNIDLFNNIIIGNNVFIGLNSIILYGSKIGNNVIVGAGSIVKGELLSNSVYAGIPVKYICTIEEYKNKNLKYFMSTFSQNPIEKEKSIRKKFNR